jgi:hypothetical protein
VGSADLPALLFVCAAPLLPQVMQIGFQLTAVLKTDKDIAALTQQIADVQVRARAEG